MVVRDTFYVSPGGDTVQVLMTKKYLEALGLQVEIALGNDKKIKYEYFSIIHFFNIIRPDDILPHIQSNIPYVISTIFVDYSEYEKKARAGVSGLVFRCLSVGQIEYLKSIARFVLKGDRIKSLYYIFNGYLKSIKKIATGASYLLPNSHSEYQRFKSMVGADFPYKKIVNAIDPSVFYSDVTPNAQYSDYVICVGRIEGRKNQLNLIKAINQTSLKLAIIGKPSPNHMAYYHDCKAVAQNNPNVVFLEHLTHSDLVPIYKAAKVHVLASWFETTGLSSLEAAVMGCNIVVSPKGDTREYFEEMAFYCEPDDVESIKSAILQAFSSPSNNSLREYILANYTWENAAKQTLDAYRSVLATNNS